MVRMALQRTGEQTVAEIAITVWQNGKQREVRGEEAISIEADFAAETWTFRINPTTRVRSGRFMLIACSDLVPLSESEPDER